MRCLLIGLLSTLVVACATSPLGRSQLKLFPDQEVDAMGVAAYREIRADTPVSTNAQLNSYVRCVADAVTAELDAGAGTWEVTVFAKDEANAFALPGRKIGVYAGITRVAQNQDQLATVVAHEVAHVLAGHANERISTQFATETGLDLIKAAASRGSSGQQQLFGLLGVGAQVGILLPFSRTQESEADLLGLDLMADAGFDPRESVSLWMNMEKAGDGSPPEFLSTHPSGKTRIEDLRQRIPQAMARYRLARERGKRPQCGP